MEKRKALFLDRDGVICAELGRYRLLKDGFELMPGIKSVIHAAKEHGYKVVVVTNQPQISKGLLSEVELHKLHNEMERLLDHELDAVYHCPHVDADNCDCRKPKAGMFRQAAQDLNIDCTQSILVGDGDKDVLAGQAVGCKTIFVKNEFKAKYLANCSPDHIVQSPEEVLDLI
ncbi:MAG: HAD family hydrolase [Patescibacteria group bacterium]